MDVDVNMKRRFPVNRIGRHSDGDQVVLINISRWNLWVTHITKNSTKVENFLANLTHSHVFNLRRRENDRILTTWLPRHRSTIHHDDVRDVRVANISVTGPVRVHPCSSPATGVTSWVLTCANRTKQQTKWWFYYIRINLGTRWHRDKGLCDLARGENNMHPPHTRTPHWWLEFLIRVLNNMVRIKIRHYRQLYTDQPDPILFLPIIVNISGHVYNDFVQLLFLHAHREASILTGELPRNLLSFAFYELNG